MAISPERFNKMQKQYSQAADIIEKELDERIKEVCLQCVEERSGADNMKISVILFNRSKDELPETVIQELKRRYFKEGWSDMNWNIGDANSAITLIR